MDLQERVLKYGSTETRIICKSKPSSTKYPQSIHVLTGKETDQEPQKPQDDNERNSLYSDQSITFSYSKREG